MAVVAHPDQCTLCVVCLDVCRRSAIALRETAEVDAALCTGCGACIDACPNGVLEMVGG
ncbi:MAG TPA: 4Fe-4S dicluster domain-containing protein [Thermoleophilia bacterium]|nr:4Fe-4S dicluster domain-containing protein [Thermoleophilia bacterium]